MKSSFKEIVAEFVALQNYSELKSAIDSDDNIERDIYNEVSKPKIVNGVELKSINIPQQMYFRRKDYYDFAKYNEYLSTKDNKDG